jgi:hypothetical protein
MSVPDPDPISSGKIESGSRAETDWEKGSGSGSGSEMKEVRIHNTDIKSKYQHSI